MEGIWRGTILQVKKQHQVYLHQDWSWNWAGKLKAQCQWRNSWDYWNYVTQASIKAFLSFWAFYVHTCLRFWTKIQLTKMQWHCCTHNLYGNKPMRIQDNTQVHCHVIIEHYDPIAKQDGKLHSILTNAFQTSLLHGNDVCSKFP